MSNEMNLFVSGDDWLDQGMYVPWRRENQIHVPPEPKPGYLDSMVTRIYLHRWMYW